MSVLPPDAVPPRKLPDLPSGTPDADDLLLVDVGGVSSKCTVAVLGTALATPYGQVHGEPGTQTGLTEDVWGAVSGTTTAGLLSGFAAGNNSLTYTGPTRVVRVTAVLSVSDSGSAEAQACVLLDGSPVAASLSGSVDLSHNRASSLVADALVSIATGQVLRVGVRNTGGSGNITVERLSLIVVGG